MTKRLAIQFFGHLRSFEKTFRSFQKNVLDVNKRDEWHIDIFMHTWDEIEYQSLQWHNNKIPELRGKKLSAQHKKFIEDNYKPVALEITPQLESNNTDSFPEFTGGYTKYSTMLNVYFTKERVNQLRLNYEKENNVNYDIVLNTRADVDFKSPFRIDEILNLYKNGLLKNFDSFENKLFYSGHHRNQAVLDEKLLAASDILYFGTPDVLNKISKIYSTLDKEELLNNFMSWEQFQIYTTLKNNIKPLQLAYSIGSDWNIKRLYKPKFKSLRKFISCFVPSKNLRKKIRA